MKRIIFIMLILLLFSCSTYTGGGHIPRIYHEADIMNKATQFNFIDFLYLAVCYFINIVGGVCGSY